MTRAEDRERFEQFYKAVRDDLLLQTYALTGDLSAAERAVRDALVQAWHHWRKVSRLEDPVAWVRPLAWSRAQRRHIPRWWHRQRDIPDDTRATLDALGSLSPTQRKALLLTTLTAQPLDDIAAEVGLGRTALERELQLASSQFALAREVSSTSVRPLVEALRPQLAGTRWPRSTIVMRSGATRRRTHTAVGVAAAAAVTVVAGSLVTGGTGVATSLADKGLTSVAPAPASPSSTTPTPEPPLVNDVLVGAEQLGTDLGGTWAIDDTSRNTEGDGLNITCQRSRYADPRGVGSLVRTFEAPATGRGRRATPARTAVQAVERSVDDTTAAATYELVRSWYGACTEPRVQLLSTQTVTGAGDAAMLVAMRSWASPATTLVVGVARTGAITTTVATSTPGTAAADLQATGVLLAGAVGTLCTAPGGGTCPTDPAAPVLEEARPVPLEQAPAMIGELDLPPIDGIDAPWAGTAPAAATTNDAATRCDDADFSTGGVTNAATRSFLIPEATDLPPQFGLTETVGSLPTRRAKAFVERVRDRLATCAERDLGTQVTQTDDVDSQRRSMTAWTLRIEISEDRFVDYRMAIMRSGTSVAQLGFIAADDADLTAQQFRDLCTRALQRLDQLPPPT